MNRNDRTAIKMIRNSDESLGCYRNGVLYSFDSLPDIPDTPDPPVLVKVTYSTIEVVFNELYEYSLDGVNWQDGAIFNGIFNNLEPETTYFVYQRVMATLTTQASDTSLPLEATTEEAPIMMTNLIYASGNMVDVDNNNLADGWTYSTMSGIDVVNNEAIIKATAQNGLIRIRNFVTGRVYFGCGMLKADSTSVRLSLVSATSAHSGDGEYEFKGRLATATGTTNNFAIQDTRSSGWTNINFKLAYLFDITTDFEGETMPTEEQLQEWMEYYISSNPYSQYVPFGTIPEEPLEYGEAWAESWPELTAEDVGVANASLLVPQTGTITINNSNTTIENVDLTGRIVIGNNAENITIRNCKITPVSGSYYGIQIYSGTNILVEDVEIDLSNCLSTSSAGIIGSNWTARRVYTHESGSDGYKAVNNCLLESCYTDRLGMRTGAHADGLQISAGSGLTIRGCTFEMPTGVPGFISTSNLMLKSDSGDITDITVEYNYFNGGGYTIYITEGTAGYTISDVDASNNRFGRDYAFGILAVGSNVTTSEYTWDNNTFKDTNVIIPNVK